MKTPPKPATLHPDPPRFSDPKVELQFLLRQVLYARNRLGAKFCDELAEWGLQDLEQRITIALEK